jgi:tetratricopeptide (TPR) repeat protein
VTGFKYRAFLSYSHADTAVVKRVHGRLESFPIDKDIVGRETPLGPIPKILRPIFRDRNDFDAGASLGEQTVTTLDDSAAMIVIASPRSAGSSYVNEEIRLFKSRHPDRAVIPLISDGSPGGENECFAPALRFVVGADGSVTDVPAHVLAADLREKGDGFDLALAKVVARLIGLPPDDVYRRAERERRKQSRLRAAVVAVVLALVGTGGFLFWRSNQQGVVIAQQGATLDEIRAIVDRLLPIGSAEAATPGARENLTARVKAIAEGAATDPRYAQALELLKQGKPADAVPLLKAVAEDMEKRADKDAKAAAAAYRNLASIAAAADHKGARDYYAEAARLDPSDVVGMFLNGWYQYEVGDLKAAETAYGSVIDLTKTGGNEEWAIWARNGLGYIQKDRGDLGAALGAYQDAEAIADRLAKSDPGNANWQRDLSASYDNVADVLAAQGNLSEALKSYRDSLAIRDRLTKSDPGNADRQQHDLSVSYNKVGDVLAAQGNLPEALKSYRDALEITGRLAKSDPGNANWQHDFSVSGDNVGDMLAAQGNLPEALKSYRDGHVIHDRLAKSDPGNAHWQRDLSVSDEKVGDVLAAEGNLSEALKSYRDGLVIHDRLAKSDPGNAGWQRDLSVSDEKVGEVLAAEGNLPEALKSYRDALAIADRLAKSDPDNADWQRDLSVSDEKVGDVLVAQGNLPEALKSYRDSLVIRDRVAKSDLGNAGWQRDLGVSYEKVGDDLAAQGNLPEALNSYSDGNVIFDRLAHSDPENADWQRDLSVSYERLSDLFLKFGDKAKALDALRQGREVIQRMTTLSHDNTVWKNDLALFDRQIATLSK